MKFQIYSRDLIEHAAPNTDAWHVLISITTPGDHQQARLPICITTLGVLHLQFHDADQMPTQPLPTALLTGSDAPQEVIMFDEAMAKGVLDFIYKHVAKLELVIVHCDAGMCRSPAVAAALACTIFGQSDTTFFQCYRPNMLVYRTICNAFTG